MNTKHNIKLLATLLCALVFSININAQQQSEEQEKAEREAQNLLNDAEDYLSDNNFPLAEASYRKAIAKDPNNQVAKYNFGNLYYRKDKVNEAGEKYVSAENTSEEKALKHKSAHNLGNTFMRNKNYAKAVEAYKQALRNDPTDEETRYNLALAKDLLEKEQKNGGGGDDDNKDQDQNKDEQQQDQEKKEGDDGEKDKNDKGEENEDGDEGDDKENKKDEGDKEENEDGKPKDEKSDQQKGKDGDQKQPQQPQPQQGQLSEQQIKNLLETMANQEAKVQEKLNAKKAKAVKVKTEKDW